MSLEDMYAAAGIQDVVDPPPHPTSRQHRATRPMRVGSLRLRPQGALVGPKGFMSLKEMLQEA
eukprot:706860-Karenia_brevis.AAC.1